MTELLDKNKMIARRLYAEVISGGNWAVADELLHVNLADYSNPPGWPEGREGAKQNINDDLKLMQQLGLMPEPVS